METIVTIMERIVIIYICVCHHYDRPIGAACEARQPGVK